jgi:hypothetical protein
MIASTDRLATDMAANEIGRLILASEIFPDIESDLPTLECLLRGLSRTETLLRCAKLNCVISDPEVEHMAKQQFGLDQFLTPEEIERVNNIARGNEDGAQGVTVFFRGQLLELIRWAILYCSDHTDDGRTFEDPEVRRRFAKATVVAGDIFSKRVFGDRFSHDDGIDAARRRSLGAIRKAIEGTLQTPELAKSLGRGWTFFTDCLPEYNRSFNSDFQSSTGLSIEDYFICLAVMITSFLKPKVGTDFFDPTTIGRSTPFADILHRYVDLESQTKDELRRALWPNSDSSGGVADIPDYDYKPLRQKPILRLVDDRAIILDPIFFYERASVGPLFHLPETKRSQAIADFGKAFEAYSCDMVGRMFPDISQATDKRFRPNIITTDREGKELQIDGCLNDVLEIVLFEIKSGFIPEDSILSASYENYLDQIRKRYVSNQNNKGVGAGQLARAINGLADKKWLGSHKEFCKARLVYPVLLVHDQLLDAPVHGHHLALEFKELLSPDNELPSGELVKAHLRIAPLIIMTVDDLENFEVSIEHFAFRDLLSAYSQHSPDRLMSLHNFIAVSAFKNHIYQNKTLAAAGFKILEEAKESVFPDV